MNKRPVLGVFLMLLGAFNAPFSAAQGTKPPKNAPKSAIMQLKMALTGDFAYRFMTPKDETNAPTPLPVATSGVVALPLPANIPANEATLEIYDNTRGNLARLDANTATPVEVLESQFKYIQSVRVPVLSQNKPVNGVQVTLESANKAYLKSIVLKAADMGIARFENVPLNEPVTITARYSANPPKSVTETLPRAHPPDGHLREPIQVDWADVKTISAMSSGVPTSPSSNSTSPSPISNSAAPQPLSPSQSASNSILNSLIGLVFVVAVGYGLFWAYKTGKLKAILQNLNINTEVPETTSGGGASPFAKPEMPPITPITEGVGDPFAPVTPASPSGPRLVGAMGTYAGVIFPLNTPNIVIGRDETNPIALPNDGNASRRHAIISQQGGQFVLQDNGSANGTFLNGVRIPAQTPHPLTMGDEVQIGLTRFRFEC